jgi:putative transposase
LPSELVIRKLKQIILWRDKPEVIRYDNNPEYISAAIKIWAHEIGIRLEYIQLGNPQQNAYVELFNRTVRNKFLFNPTAFISCQINDFALALQDKHAMLIN